MPALSASVSRNIRPWARSEGSSAISTSKRNWLEAVSTSNSVCGNAKAGAAADSSAQADADAQVIPPAPLLKRPHTEVEQQDGEEVGEVDQPVLGQRHVVDVGGRSKDERKQDRPDHKRQRLNDPAREILAGGKIGNGGHVWVANASACQNGGTLSLFLSI